MRNHLNQFLTAGNMQFDPYVLLADDCEGTQTWILNSVPAGGTANTQTAAALTGTKGILLATDSGSPGPGDAMTIERYLELPEPGLLVFRARIAARTIADVATIEILLTLDHNSRTRLAQAVWTPATPKLEYLNAAGVLTATALADYAAADETWFTWELQLDLRQMEWVSLAFGGQTADLAGVSIRDSGVSTYRRCILAITVTAAGATSAVAYIDNIHAACYRAI